MFTLNYLIVKWKFAVAGEWNVTPGRQKNLFLNVKHFNPPSHCEFQSYNHTITWLGETCGRQGVLNNYLILYIKTDKVQWAQIWITTKMNKRHWTNENFLILRIPAGFRTKTLSWLVFPSSVIYRHYISGKLDLAG